MSELIKYETLREKVSAYIRDEILSLRLAPGERIIENDLSEKLNISRGPIREALRELEKEGLVEYQRNRGCIVRRLSVEDAAEIFYIRSSLEAASVRYCQGQFPQETLSKMEEIVDQLQQIRPDMQNPSLAFVELDQQFHACIASACGLKRLFQAWDMFSPMNIVLFLTESRADFVLEMQYSRHSHILETMRKGDVEEICQSIHEHYLKTSAINAKGKIKK